MGCGSSSDKRARLYELDNLLQEQEKEKAELKSKIKEIQGEYQNSDDDGNDDKLSNKIERLSSEKKQVFKTMLQEKKKISSLENKIQEYQTKIHEIERDIKSIKDEKNNNTEEQKQDTLAPSILAGISIPKALEIGASILEATPTSPDDEPLIRIPTERLDVAFNATVEASNVYSWIHGQKIDPKNKKAVSKLKQQLATLLTSRSEGYRQTLQDAYYDKYGKDMGREIKVILIKGQTMEIIHGLLMQRAEFDAMKISEHIANWAIEPVAGVICCRSMLQIQELYDAYKAKCKLDVKKQLSALAQKNNKRTLIKIIGGIFDLSRKQTPNVDINEVNGDLNFMLTTKNFKGEAKEKLALIFTTNSVPYIKILNDQFKIKSKDNLIGFIDKKLGSKSTAGHFCKTRILYALDTPDYYAQKIKKLGGQYQKNRMKISDIFIQRMETDLDLIQRIWTTKKYGDGKSLKDWIAQKSRGANSGFFLQKMLENCGRYTEFINKNQPDPTSNKSKLQKMMM